MPVTITIDVPQTTLLMQQTVAVIVVLHNGGAAPLVDLNPMSCEGYPELLLTDLATGEQTEHAITPVGPRGQVSFDLPAGDTQRTEFDLNRIAPIPRPGRYELRARTRWTGGRMVSDAVELTVTPVTPAAFDLATVRGGLTPLYMGVGTNGAVSEEGKTELLLWDILASSEVGVTNVRKLADVPEGIAPIISVPPNDAPALQWIVWLEPRDEGGVARALSCRHGDCSKIVESKLKAPGARLLSPALLDKAAKGSLPGASILGCYADKGGGPDHLFLLRIGPKGIKEESLAVELPADACRWAATAYRSNHDRRTYLLTEDGEGEVSLHVMSWSNSSLPKAVDVLCGWDARFVAGGITTTKDDHVRGLVLAVDDDQRYSMIPWLHAAGDEFRTVDPISVKLPAGVEVTKAIPAINQNGAPYVAMCVKNAPYAWCLAQHDGSVVALPTQTADPRLLLDVAFRLAELPIAIHAEPGRGLMLSDPG